jgi:uncharacterized membrane protein AbrB (regulator of aidB expression)
MNHSESLWLPPGSVRALLALLAVLAVIVGAFLRLPTEYFTALVGIASAWGGYYFGSKGTGKAGG